MLKRLIIGVAQANKLDLIEALFEIYDSYLIEKIDDYNSSLYYENPSYLLAAYQRGRLE